MDNLQVGKRGERLTPAEMRVLQAVFFQEPYGPAALGILLRELCHFRVVETDNRERVTLQNFAKDLLSWCGRFEEASLEEYVRRLPVSAELAENAVEGRPRRRERESNEQ